MEVKTGKRTSVKISCPRHFQNAVTVARPFALDLVTVTAFSFGDIADVDDNADLDHEHGEDGRDDGKSARDVDGNARDAKDDAQEIKDAAITRVGGINLGLHAKTKAVMVG